ncbi:MAG: GAF domain-containing protein, partial [Anaerolineae bacterium]|nr:GAF domain-containing protein [Anaerolineae bacterium]
MGVNLNAQRDLSLLPQEILEAVDELSGAERIALVLLDDEGNYREVKTILPRPAFPSIAGKVLATPDPVAFIAEIDLHLKEVVHTRQGFIRLINPEADLLTQRSILSAPLLSQGKLVGVIYCDLRGCFGRFDPEDLSLLGVLTNQAAVALENAHWSATLERKVTDRTVELKLSNSNLEQRNAELAVINSVQAGLASKLDIQEIYELVGEKIKEIFDANTVVLATFDLEKNLMYRHYTIERGERFSFDPMPIPRIWSHFINQGQPLLANKNVEEGIREIDPDFVVPAGEMPQSVLSVPFKLHGNISGSISLQNVDREDAFSEADMHLLETVANSLSVALENARLFDETQRLVKAEQDRVAELEIINSIQQGLAKEMDFQAIVDLVGDKLCEVFKTGDLGITWWEEQANLVHYIYIYEHGQRLHTPPSPPISGGIYEHLMTSRQPYVMGLAEMEDYPLIPGTDRSLSAVYI